MKQGRLKEKAVFWFCAFGDKQKAVWEERGSRFEKQRAGVPLARYES